MSEKNGRNAYDIVMELVNIHLSSITKVNELTESELERIYLKYYNLVKENK